MVESREFNPNKQHTACVAYLRRALKQRVRLIHAEPLSKSTRDAPWRLDTEVEGVVRRYVLRINVRGIEHEYAVLCAMESVPVPTPRAYGLDPHGEALGAPCFIYEFIEGESLLKPMLAGERWAEDLYIETVCNLQEVSRLDLREIEHRLQVEETAKTLLEAADTLFREKPNELAEVVSAKLRRTMPECPPARFSNGDLWLDNFISRDGRLAGVIDFENAGFSDPVYEFLLPFFVAPDLRGRGIEERYCERMGFDSGSLHWYRGLEYYDTWHWVEKTGKPFEQHTSESLQMALESWLDE
jgi:aminoglycoside phosphotransferase (APT) family kinase protein